jgi:hypothetical protein
VLKDHGVPFGIIANSGPYLATALKAIDRKLSTIKARISLSNVPVYNAWDHGFYKPQPQLFEAAALDQGLMERSTVSYFIGADPILDTVPKSVPFMNSILLTSRFGSPESDIKDLPVDQIKKLSHFRIQNLDELKPLFRREPSSYHPQRRQPWTNKQRSPRQLATDNKSTASKPKIEHTELSQFKQEKFSPRESRLAKRFASHDKLPPL